MITVDDIKRSILISTAEEFSRQCQVLASITKRGMEDYRNILMLIRQAEEELPDVEWIKGRIEQAKDAAVEGYAYR